MYCILCMANIVDVYVYIVGAEKPRSIQCSPGKLKTVPAFMLGDDMIDTQHVYYHICVVTFQMRNLTRCNDVFAEVLRSRTSTVDIIPGLMRG